MLGVETGRFLQHFALSPVHLPTQCDIFCSGHLNTYAARLPPFKYTAARRASLGAPRWTGSWTDPQPGCGGSAFLLPVLLRLAPGDVTHAGPPGTLLTSGRALPYARSGDTPAWVEAPLVAVAVRSVPAHPNRDDWTDTAGKFNVFTDASLRHCVPCARGLCSDALTALPLALAWTDVEGFHIVHSVAPVGDEPAYGR